MLLLLLPLLPLLWLAHYCYALATHKNEIHWRRFAGDLVQRRPFRDAGGRQDVP